MQQIGLFASDRISQGKALRDTLIEAIELCDPDKISTSRKAMPLEHKLQILFSDSSSKRSSRVTRTSGWNPVAQAIQNLRVCTVKRGRVERTTCSSRWTTSPTNRSRDRRNRKTDMPEACTCIGIGAEDFRRSFERFSGSLRMLYWILQDDRNALLQSSKKQVVFVAFQRHK